MGYQTDYLGYFRIEPPLSEEEVALVNRVSGSMFLPESAGGLRVADRDDVLLAAIVKDAPRGWSNWRATEDGDCLSYDGGDKANHMVPWLRFIMTSFLLPGAPAAEAEGFTCDHVLDGMVVGSRRDTRELFAITVRSNDVEVELLWPGEPSWSDYPRLAYQIEIDTFREWVMVQRRKPRFGIDDGCGSWTSS